MKFHRKNAIRGGGLNLWLIIHLSRGEGDRKAFWEKKRSRFVRGTWALQEQVRDNVSSVVVCVQGLPCCCFSSSNMTDSSIVRKFSGKKLH